MAKNTDTLRKKIEQLQSALDACSHLYESALHRAERHETELDMIADILEGKAPRHIAFGDYPHAHNVRIMMDKLRKMEDQ